jgi:hypothetical protein
VTLARGAFIAQPSPTSAMSHGGDQRGHAFRLLGRPCPFAAGRTDRTGRLPSAPAMGWLVGTALLVFRCFRRRGIGGPAFDERSAGRFPRFESAIKVRDVGEPERLHQVSGFAAAAAGAAMNKVGF